MSYPMKKETAYIIVDYTEQYRSIMQFDKNKTVPIHQWYPFVEGYSKEFIQSILDELPYRPKSALEPFAGSGTTPVELQDLDIKCTSFEVSPFMHLLSTVKMRRDYTRDEFTNYLNLLKNKISISPRNIRKVEPIPFGRTVAKQVYLKKWNFHDNTLDGILDIKHAIAAIPEEKYRNIFIIALASILLDVSNLFRNGKCLSYKKNWQSLEKTKRTDIHQTFFKRIESTFLEDISNISPKTKPAINNYQLCHYGDIREKIDLVPDNSIDLIITSPPYLNSRDYTDIYMLELKTLDLIKSHEELRALRKRTLRSHVQVKFETLETLDIPLLKESVASIEKNADSFWNSDLLNMIKGYFIDIDYLFSKFKEKMLPEKFIYFNVANSAYYGEEITVDEIVCEIAKNHGFEIIEIRKARDLNPSSQQHKLVAPLRESVIVMKS